MIQLTQGLRTDTPSSFLQIVNDNFTIVQDSINNTFTLLDTTAKTLTGMSTISTNAFNVGNILTVNSSQFIVNASPTVTGDLKVIGNLIRAKIKPLTDSQNFSIGAQSVYPDYYGYLVSSSTVGGNTIDLYPGINYQEILIVFTNSISGVETFVTINNSHASIALPAGTTKIVLSAIGHTVSLKYIDGTYYIIGGNGYTTEA